MLTIYKASAGSGKTFTLAYEYIKLLLGVCQHDGKYVLNHNRYIGAQHARITHPHSKILAITFTNKATAEMKARIIKELKALTIIPDQPKKDTLYAKNLVKEFGCTRQELQQTALETLRKVLFDYSAFNVSTIDAFFQNVLRTFAREIDRQGDYSVELDKDSVLTQSLGMLFDDINVADSDLDRYSDTAAEKNASKALRNWLSDISLRRSQNGHDFNPFNRSSQFYRAITKNISKALNEKFIENEDAINKYLAATATEKEGAKLADFEKGIKDLLTFFDTEIRATARQVFSVMKTVEGIAAYPFNLIEKIATAKSYKGVIFSPIFEHKAYVEKLLNDDPSGLVTKKFIIDDSSAQRIMKGVQAIAKMAKALMMTQEIAAKIHTLTAMMHIRRYMEQYRRDNNLILISDTTSLLKSIITDADTPFVYERMGVRLQNLLIDEFQDTSALQWENLEPLLSNSMADGFDNLIIGDVKQSIYRWRGAESSLLDHTVGQSFRRDQQIAKGDNPGENTNYRSAHLLVKFNNTLFSHLSESQDPAVAGYGGVAQKLADKTKDLQGYVAVRDLTESKSDYSDLAKKILGEEEAQQRIDAGVVFDEDSLPKELLAHDIAQQLKRGYRLRDIAILVRKNRHATDIADYLLLNFPHIKLVSEDALRLANSQAIKIIIGILELLDKNANASEDVKPEFVEGLRTDDTPREGSAIPMPSDQLLKEEKYKAERVRKRRKRARLIDSFEYYLAHGHSLREAITMAIDRADLDYGTDEEKALAQKRTAQKAPDDFAMASDLDKIRRDAPATLYVLVETILKHKISSELREKELAYIAAFLDVVQKYCQDNIGTVHSFLQYWETHKYTLSIPADDGIDAVRILTIHQAKGLEWPCVHMPLMNLELEPKLTEQWLTMEPFRLFIQREYGFELPPAPPVLYLNPTKYFEGEDSPFINEISKQKLLTVADNLNLAYVAFTRPVNELIINAVLQNRKITSDKGTIREAMLKAFSEADYYNALTTGLSDEDVAMYTDLHAYKTDDEAAPLVFELGKPTHSDSKEAEEQTNGNDKESVELYVSINKRNLHLTKLADLTSEEDTDEDPDTGNNAKRNIVDKPRNPLMEAAARQGLAMHNILSRMTTIADLDSAIAFERKFTPADDLERYKEMLVEAFATSGDLPPKWFAPENPRILNEQPIYDASTDHNYRTDRIVFFPDGSIDVVDYKFTTQELNDHHEQVQGYMRLLRTLGHKNVSGHLWYPLKHKVVEVTV